MLLKRDDLVLQVPLVERRNLRLRSVGRVQRRQVATDVFLNGRSLPFNIT